jgi:uncharacterized protein (DUF1499 family)
MAAMQARILFVLFVSFVLSGCSGKRTVDVGCVDGKLAPCPESPNCVSSQSSDQGRQIAPFTYEGTLVEAKNALLSAIHEFPNSEIVTAQEGYVHVVFTSKVFRFVDDVEFCFRAAPGVIHVRSSSRSGYWDFGVNRKRIEKIRARFGVRLEQSRSG